MDGGEVENRQREPLPASLRDQKVRLTQAEKMDLVMLASQPVYKTLCKLFEIAVVDARDAAMMVEPGEDRKQLALMAEARAIARFSDSVRRQIEFATREHLAAIDVKAMEEALKEQERVTEIILNPLNAAPGALGPDNRPLSP